MSKEAMKLALEALTKNSDRVTEIRAKEKAITALREALAEPSLTAGFVKKIESLIAERDALTAKLAEQPAQHEPVAWVPYLSDRADGVSGHYAIARWNPRGYREVWNLRRHAWAAYSDDVLSLEEADTLLRLIEIPTRKVETPQPAQRKPLTDEQIDAEFDAFASKFDHESNTWLDMGVDAYFRAGFKAAHGIKENT